MNEEISEDLFDILFSESTFENRMNILIKQIPSMEKEQISKYLLQFEKPFSELTEKSARPLKFTYSETNYKLIELLRDKDYIGKKFTVEKDFIKVNRKRK